MDPFIGEIRPVPYNFAPQGWALCQGQIMSISQNTALFSLLGTAFGGNGVTTFGLPDLRGRAPLGAGPAYETFDLGQQGGEETIPLTGANVPAHPHNVSVSITKADSLSPVGNEPASSDNPVYDPGAKDLFNANAVAIAGQGQPHNNIQPYTAINYIIALEGIFPSRS